jgi:hypothetical protein
MSVRTIIGGVECWSTETASGAAILIHISSIVFALSILSPRLAARITIETVSNWSGN